MRKRIAEMTEEERAKYRAMKSASDRRYRENNKEKLVDKSRKYYLENKESISIKSAQKYRETSEVVKARTKAWKERNRAKHNANCMARYTKKLNATPGWLDELMLLVIDEYYDLAQKMQKLTGVPHEVDHIIPLQGKNVCGLNVPWNLQLLTQSENASKKNKVFQELARDVQGWK